MTQSNESANFFGEEEEEDRMLIEALRLYEAGQKIIAILSNFQENIVDNFQFDEHLPILTDFDNV
jgi:hypothetical protein